VRRSESREKNNTRREVPELAEKMRMAQNICCHYEGPIKDARR